MDYNCLALAVLLTLVKTTIISAAYTFPDYEIEVYSPKGFKISIPTSEDLTLFAVHININKEMEYLEAGEIAVDVVKPRGDRWVYENKKVRLRAGDKLYFWLYAIVDGLGYRLDNQEYTVPGDILATTVISQKQPTSEKCQSSITTVAGKPMCKGEILFFEQFQNKFGWGSNNNWTTEVQIPRTAESYFIILDDTNRLVENGFLDIKPSLTEEKYGETFVRNGHLKLDGCTAETRELCESRGFSWDIIPPVLTSRISTRNSFSFKYGHLEIRAKLPKGDWIVPEIWLVGKSYGPNSGRIILAQSLGNNDLKLDGSNIGGQILNQGISTNETNKIMFSKSSDKMWSDDFHLYKIEWSPGQIIFKVDESVVGHLNPNHKLFNDIGTTNLAPFDTEFYISLGIHVGGRVDFPDNCINQGKPKPWEDGELRNKLKFWLSKDKWYQTWGDHSKLLVDYVKVTAL